MKKTVIVCIIGMLILTGCGNVNHTDDLLALGNEDAMSVEDIAENAKKAADEDEKSQETSGDNKSEEKTNKETKKEAKKTNSDTKTKKQETKTETKKTETKKSEAKSDNTKKSETPKKTEPVKSDNKLDSMSGAEKKEVNMFLSNFSEAGYKGTQGGVSANADKISFAFCHLEINENDKVIYNDLQMGVSAKDVDRVLERFFGESVPHETPDGSKWIYDDGYFMMGAASGESRAYFSVATYMKDNKDGTYNVDFNIYHDSKNPHDYPNNSWYSLSDSEAKSKYKKTGTGSAVLEPKKHNGTNTYQIVFYKAN